MILDELRAKGRAGAARVIDEVRRRLGASSLVPEALVPSPYTSPPEEFERPPPRLKMAPARADERAVGWRAAYLEAPKAASPTLVAFHHSPTPADWLEVARARPQFEGHGQPRLPAMGFYDPRSADVLVEQVALARVHGVAAFAFVLADTASALDAFLTQPTLALSFCIAWRGTDDARALERLLVALDDPRYLRSDGRAVVIVERADAALAKRWRDAVRERGLGEVLLLGRGATNEGVDATLREPSVGASVKGRQALLNPAFSGDVFDSYADAPASAGLALVSVGHDDEPHRPGAGRVVQHDSPRAHRDRLAAVRARASLVFLDSWNDWTRGAVLEPDARLGHAYLAATRDALSPPPPSSRPVVVIHAYYVELLEEIAVALRQSRLDARVIVTTPFDREAEVRARLDELGLAAEVEGHENRGRDLLPFLRVANRLLDEGAELVLKLHTKSSGHRVDGARWRAELIGRLLEPSRIAPILGAFASDSRLGCVAPEGHHLPLSVYWGWNEETVRYLCVRMGVADPRLSRDRFAAGSMFWARLSALRPLLDAHLGEWEFPAEGGYVDGTMAHGIERALALAVQGAGFVSRTAAAVCGLPFDDAAAFAYAEATGPEEP